jgi:hypothetical protein
MIGSYDRRPMTRSQYRRAKPRRLAALRRAGLRLLGPLLAPMFLALAVCGPALADTATLPALPCASDPAAVYPPFADPPNARIWHRRDLGDWQPPACFGWPPLPFNLVTALSGEFKFDGDADELLARFGAVSGWKGIRYWSLSDRRWETFITDSAALEDPNGQARRPDFTPAELKTGADVYFLRSDDSTSDPVIYRMRVAEVGPDRLVVRIGNVSPISRFIFTLFDAGDIQSTYILKKVAPGRWGYYALTVLEEGVMVIGNHDEAYLTRTVAIFRHLAGIPTDQEPPVVR